MDSTASGIIAEGIELFVGRRDGQKQHSLGPRGGNPFVPTDALAFSRLQMDFFIGTYGRTYLFARNRESEKGNT